MSADQHTKPPIDFTDPRALRGPQRWKWIVAAVVAFAFVLVVALAPHEESTSLLRITKKQDWRTQAAPAISGEAWRFYIAQHNEFEKSGRSIFQVPGKGTVHVDIDEFVVWTKYSKGRSVAFNFNGADIEVFDVDNEIRKKMCEVAAALDAHVADESGKAVACS